MKPYQCQTLHRHIVIWKKVFHFLYMFWAFWVVSAWVRTNIVYGKLWVLPPWWRHQMETYSALLALCEGNSPVNSPHKGQWRGALMFSLICAQTNGWVNNRDAGDLRRHRAHHDVTVMSAHHNRLLSIRYLGPYSSEFELKSGYFQTNLQNCD